MIKNSLQSFTQKKLEFVRDVTSIAASLSKSEVTRRLDELIFESIEQAHKEGYSEGGLNQFQHQKELIKTAVDNAVAEQTPMGVSQWREHGKKYGYEDFFIKQAREEERERIKEIIGKMPSGNLYSQKLVNADVLIFEIDNQDK